MNTNRCFIAQWVAGHRFLLAITLLILIAIGHGSSTLCAAVPGITSEPADAAKLVGQNAAFSVVVSNTAGAGYQWFYESSQLSSRTNSTLTLIGLVTNSSGHYSVVITNSEGSTTSRLASLTVTQPDYGFQTVSGLINMTSYHGQNGLVVNVVVTGSTNGGNIWGTGIYTDDSSLQLAAAHAGYLTNGQVGTLLVKILPGQSSYSGTTSHGVTSTSYGSWTGSYQIIGIGPSFSAQPMSRVAWTGGKVSFTSQAFAATTPLFQWKHNGSSMIGQTNNSLVLSNLTSVDAGTYAVIAHTAQGTNASEVVALVVVDSTSGSPPVNDPTYGYGLSYLEGQVYRVIVTGNTNPGSLYGSGIYTLDTSLGLAAVHNGLLSAGEQGTLALIMLPAQPQFPGSTRNGLTSLTRSYYYQAFGFLALTPTITLHPLGQGVLAGGSAGFSVSATSRTAPIQYQWRHNGGNLLGETNFTLSLNNVTNTDSGQYDVFVSNPDGGTLSIPAPLIVVSPTNALQNGGSICSAANGAVVFNTVVGITNGGLWGDGVYTCDSSVATAAVHAGLLASGQTGAVAVVVSPGQPQYFSTTRNGVTSTAFGPFIQSYSFIGLAPYVTSQPQSQSVSVGDATSFGVTATSSMPVKYYWRKGNVPMLGENSNTLMINNITTNDAAQYSVIVSNQLGFVTSTPATLTVNASATVQLKLASPGVLNLSGATGVTWQVQSRDSIVPGTWLPLSNVFLDISPKSFTDNNSVSKSNRFYRAQKMP